MDKSVLAFHEEGFPQTVASECIEIIKNVDTPHIVSRLLTWRLKSHISWIGHCLPVYILIRFATWQFTTSFGETKSKSKCLLAQQCGICLTNIHKYNRNTHTHAKRRKNKTKQNNCTGNSNIRVIIRWNYSIHEQCILPLVLGQLTIPISVYVYMYVYMYI